MTERSHLEDVTLLMALNTIATSVGLSHDLMVDVRREQRELRRVVDTIHASQENMLMALDASFQAIVDEIKASTTAVAQDIAMAVRAITDLVNQVSTGTTTAADLENAIRPMLDSLNLAAEALAKTATDADPAIANTAPAEQPTG